MKCGGKDLARQIWTSTEGRFLTLYARREDYYEYGFNAKLNTIDYIGPRF
ncbi:hypothetical protein [Candidatus Avelusimicrobium faecicola]